MIAPAFYRSLLTPAEQLAYRQLVTGLLTGKGTIFIPQGMVPTAQLHRVVQAVHLDHPELFEIQWWEYRFAAMPDGSYLRFRRMLEPGPSEAIRNSLNTKTACMRQKLADSPSVEDAYLQIAKEIASTTKYVDSGSAFWDHTLVGPALRHTAVCEGVSKFFLFCCQRAGLPCAIVTGTLHGVPHAWNMVELTPYGWAYLDVTGMLQSRFLCTPLDPSPFQTGQQLRRNGYQWPSAFICQAT